MRTSPGVSPTNFTILFSASPLAPTITMRPTRSGVAAAGRGATPSRSSRSACFSIFRRIAATNSCSRFSISAFWARSRSSESSISSTVGSFGATGTLCGGMIRPSGGRMAAGGGAGSACCTTGGLGSGGTAGGCDWV